MSYTDVIKRMSLWLLLVVWGFSSVTASAAPDKDKDKNPRPNRSQSVAKNGSAAGECTIGAASADLNINNVNARIFNTGAMFYSHTGDALYEVPNGADKAPIFAHGLWIGGMAGGELRMSAATYAQFGEEFEMFPGPIDASGNPPANCAEYDRLYKVSKDDIVRYETTGQAVRDLQEWPYQLGAPVLDGDGNRNNYNLAGGDRPAFPGATLQGGRVVGGADQMVWWIMNDAAGQHLTTQTNPIGLEVKATAFAFKTADALNNTTFYKYNITYKPKQNVPLEDTWIGLWSDPDLGNANDDYVGSDTLLGLGFVYNGDPFDETSSGYGDRPPALGYDFFQGPLVDKDGIDNNNNGTVDEPGERLQMTRFVYYNNVNGAVNGNPDGAEDFYGYLQGLWTDNTPMTFGGNGVGGSTVTRYMFPAEPGQYWSEDNVDGKGGRNQPSDRRFLMSTGPFTMQPGDQQELVFGIVWSQTRNRFGSVKQLKADDILAQGAFDFNFQLPPPPDAPRVTATEMDGQVILSWANPVTSNNYLNQYDVESPFLVDPNAVDQTYTFEGYKIYQYPNLSVAPEDGVLIATYDVNNGITSVVDNKIDPTTGAPIRVVSAAGTDSGVKDYIIIDKDYITDRSLNNYTEYYFGVQAYAYNPASDPQIRQSPVVRVKVVPQNIATQQGGSVLKGAVNDNLTGKLTAGIGEGAITSVVADPTKVTGAQYDVKFYRIGGASNDSLMTYDVVNRATGAVLVNGREYFQLTRKALPQGKDVFVADGLSFSISGPDPDFTSFQVVSNADGPLNPPEIGTFAFNSNGFPFLGASDRPDERQQVGPAEWGIVQGYDPTHDDYETFKEIITSFQPLEAIGPYDWEIRFTARGGKAWAFNTGKFIDVPFELWRIGAGTPNNPADDVRYFPYVEDLNENGKFDMPTQPELNALVTDPATAIPADHNVSGGTNDPYTDNIIWIIPKDLTPGEAGYNFIIDYITRTGSMSRAATGSGLGMAYMSIANWNGGLVTPGNYNQALPETGTTFRIITAKPIAAGDVYTVETAGFERLSNVDSVAVEGLERIAIVPNPYRGASTYDVSPFQDEARITNLPVGARIRVFALNGTLIFEDTQRSGDGFYRWDLTTNDGLPIASGMYLIHVDIPDVGERVLKFGVVKKRVQLDVY